MLMQIGVDADTEWTEQRVSPGETGCIRGQDVVDRRLPVSIAEIDRQAGDGDATVVQRNRDRVGKTRAACDPRLLIAQPPTPADPAA